MFTGAWCHDVSPRERFQVQEMLNRLAEESVRRLEMQAHSSRKEATVRISSSPDNFLLLQHSSTTRHVPQVTETLYLATDVGKRESRVHDIDAENDDDDVLEDNDEETDKYLSFPLEEDQIHQRDGWDKSYSSVHHSSLDDDSCTEESQGASGGNHSPWEDTAADVQSRRRKGGGLPISRYGDCPMIHKMTLRKDPNLCSDKMGSDYEMFGIEVVAGRMCTGGFLCVYVAKVVEGSQAEQCIREGDQILEWDQTSLVDVSFEKANVSLPPHRLKSHLSFVIMQPDSIKCWSRWSLAQLADDDCVFDEVGTCSASPGWKPNSGNKEDRTNTDYEMFGIEVVAGRMCTGGFLCVYVAKVVEGSQAEQCIREGDQILEWDQTSLVDVSFEKANVSLPPHRLKSHLSFVIMQPDSIKCWSRWSLAQLADDDCVFDELHIWHDPHGNNMTVRVLNARGLSLQLMPNQELPNPYILLYLLPNREISIHFWTNTDPEKVTPKWDLSFVFSNIPESELPSRTLEATLWSEVPGNTNKFLGEVLIKMSPTLLCSGAQWFNIEDHDEASTFLPVPTRRRHTLSPRLLPPINEVRSSNEEVKNDSIHTGFKAVNRSLSTVNISTCIAHVFINESDGIPMQSTRRRRADSVVTMKAFRPKRKSNFQRMESFRRRFLDSSYRRRSAPTTPSVSIPQSMDDLRKKRAMTRSTDGLKLSFNLSDYLTSSKSAQENAREIEYKGQEEREGKKRGALRAMKRYPANFRIRLGKLIEKPCQLGEVAEPGASGPMMSGYHDFPGYLSAPTTPSVSTSTEDLRRERSLTNYLQVPRSPGVFAIFKRRNDSQSSELRVNNVAEGDEPTLHFTFPKPIPEPPFGYVDEEEATPEEHPPRDANAEDTEAGELGWEVFSLLPTMKETELHFTFPKPIPEPPFGYVDEEEATPEEHPPRDANAEDTEAGELGNLQLAAPPSSPLDNDDQESCLSVMDKWKIAGISVRHHSTNDQTPLDLEDNEQKQGAEAPAGKKVTLQALRR
ncbi:Regulating synaptic membrane exocytosis protein 2 [Stylophora pistillata]|uniref:Regulating synaptic membrane exocytosis protein 2 n=1 Tax=Stylophora pistillata TaxID=50429 RepID=A0A2B4S8Z9_STYPI|nr:Regulating synaptic membrane exocytosis protein 2 [Stylophora pistillata]